MSNFMFKVHVCSSPFKNVLQRLVAIVGIKLGEQGRIEGIRVPDEAEHGHGHLS